MSKLSKEELIAKVNNIVTDVDSAIELIEDISDSMDEKTVDEAEVEALKSKNEELNWQLTDLKERYKNRFLGIPENPEETSGSGENENVPELETKEVVDIKEI
jgi:predicted  nucleic acid-binding Zn-ribbon protein